MRFVLIPIAIAMAIPALPAAADELSVFAGTALTLSTSSDSSTREDLNGYIEGEFAHFYAGLSADIYNGSVNDEIDPYVGYRSETGGGLSYDLSYTRSIYPNDGGDCCGDLDLSIGIPMGDKLTTTLDTNYYPEDGLADAHLSLDFALNDKVTLTAKAGIAGTNDPGGATQDWELAAAYQLGDTTAVKVHYYDGADTKPYLGLDLTWDVTLKGQ